MRSEAVEGLDTAYDKFLQAPIDADRTDRLLSVLSALARLGLDPWQEAEALKQLPPEAAITRLATLISKLPDVSPILRNPEVIAARLVALLPHRSRALPVGPPEHARETRKPVRFRTLAMSLLYLLLVTAMLIARFQDVAHPSFGSDGKPPPSTDACNPLAVCGVG